MKTAILTRRNNDYFLRDHNGRNIGHSFSKKENADKIAAEKNVIILNNNNCERKRLALVCIILSALDISQADLSSPESVFALQQQDWVESNEMLKGWMLQKFKETSVTALAHKHREEGQSWPDAMKVARIMYNFLDSYFAVQEEV